MDTRFRYELNALDTAFQLEGTRAGYCKNSFLRLNSPGLPIPHLSTSKGIKREWSLIDGFTTPNALSYLSLRPFCSSSSSGGKCSSDATAYTTLSLGKETDEGSSVDIELDFMLHAGNERAFNLKGSGTPSVLASRVRPVVDLELSLSTGANRSDIGKMPRIGALHGSTSCCWKSGVVPPPMQTSSPFMAQFFSNPVSNKEEVKQSFSDPSQSILTVPKSSVTFSSGIAQQDKSRSHTSNSKTCRVEGCGKGARGASRRCILHGGGRRCQKPGCDKGADGRTQYCKAHGGGRRCQFSGCTKSAEGRTGFCIAHGGGRRCSHEGCTRAARGKSGSCIRHGGGKRCRKENCTRSAEGLSGLCIGHGGGRRCQFIGCTKGAQGSTKFCKAHGGGKRCTALGCTKGAEGSTPFCKRHGGGKRCSFQAKGACAKSVHGGTAFCVAHGGGKRCAVPECTKSARGRTDCCVRHGGGKRCKIEECGKSAQGSTDFCKAHGGGTKCSWGRLGTEYGSQQGGSCKSFARGKSVLCTLHNGLVLDKKVHGGVILEDSRLGPRDTAGEASTEQGWSADTTANARRKAGILGSKWCSDVGKYGGEGGVPEGRVHGGSLLAMLSDTSGLALGILVSIVPPGLMWLK